MTEQIILGSADTIRQWMEKNSPKSMGLDPILIQDFLAVKPEDEEVDNQSG